MQNTGCILPLRAAGSILCQPSSEGEGLDPNSDSCTHALAPMPSSSWHPRHERRPRQVANWRPATDNARFQDSAVHLPALTKALRICSTIAAEPRRLRLCRPTEASLRRPRMLTATLRCGSRCSASELGKGNCRGTQFWSTVAHHTRHFFPWHPSCSSSQSAICHWSPFLVHGIVSRFFL